MRDYYEDNDYEKEPEIEFGCGFCWDKRKKKSKELFFLDAANNMRLCSYCPSCGRELKEEGNNEW